MCPVTQNVSPLQAEHELKYLLENKAGLYGLLTYLKAMDAYSENLYVSGAKKAVYMPETAMTAAYWHGYNVAVQELINKLDKMQKDRG